MRRLIPLLLLLFPTLAAAQPFNAQIESARGRHKIFTTGALPTSCAPGTEVFDTTAQVTKVCLNDGVTWATAGGGGTAGNVTAGTTTVTGCGAGQVLYDSGLALSCKSTFTFTASDNTLRSDGGLIMGGATSSFPILAYSTVQTPDAPFFGTGSLARNLFFGVNGGQANDFGNIPCAGAQCVNPQLTLVGTANDTAQYNSLSYAGTVGKAVSTISDGGPDAVVRVPAPLSSSVGGNIDYTIFVVDATPNFQALSGIMTFAAVNKAGTVTCVTGAGTATLAAVSAASTLACTFSCAENPADNLEISFSCNTSLTPTTMEAWTQTHLLGAGQISQQ